MAFFWISERWRAVSYPKGTMKNYSKNILKSLPVLFAAAALTACDVEKTQDGEMPDVKVEGEAKLPMYDVDAPGVEVGKKKVEIPTIDIIPADEDTNDQ